MKVSGAWRSFRCSCLDPEAEPLETGANPRREKGLYCSNGETSHFLKEVILKFLLLSKSSRNDPFLHVLFHHGPLRLLFFPHP